MTAVDRARSLAAVPVLNNGLEIGTGEDGKMVIRLRAPRGKGFLARFQPPVMIRTVKLDELGAFVVERIDGKASVKEIIESFMSRFRANRREAELSVVEFLKSLMIRGVISMTVK